MGIIDKASNIIGDASSNIISAIFLGSQQIFTSSLSTTILSLVACFWVYNKIGREWGKEDFYKAGSWLIVYIIIRVIYSNELNYRAFLNIVSLPASYFWETVKNVTASQNVDLLIQYSANFANNIWNNIGVEHLGGSLLVILLGLITLLIIWLYALFYAVFVVLIGLMSMIILSICPIMLPCLIIPNFRGYFFSWLKLYTSTAIQPVFAGIIGAIMGKAINQFGKETKVEITQDFFTNTANLIQAITEIFTIILICIAAIAALSKIPQWTQQLIGSGDGEHKTGIAGAIAGAGAMMKQGYKGYTQARSDMNYRTGGQNSIGRSLASGALSAMGMSGHAQKIAGQTSGDRGKYQDKMLQSTIQNGSFTAMPTPHIESNNANKK